MDIKTFLDNIYEHVCCPVCSNSFTHPKLLPCLHSFCLHCLQRIQATSGTRDTILCPECRRNFTIPGNGDLNTLPTNFRLNSLLEALPVTECKTSGVKCGNCDKRRQESAYCFTCCSFWCEDCLPSHNKIKTFKEHHALALKDFEDEDFENIFKQPTFCAKHEKKELDLFCQVCKTTICNSCALIDHEGHAKIALEDAANEQRLRINKVIESKKEKAQKKVTRIAKLGENCTQVQEHAERVKSVVQELTDNLIAGIEAKKTKIFDEVEKKAKQCLERLGDKSQEIEEEMKRDLTAVEKCDKMLKRSTNAQIMQPNEFLDQLFREESKQEETVDFDGKNVIDFDFERNEELFNDLHTKQLGFLKRITNPKESTVEGKGISEGTVGLPGEIVVITRNNMGEQVYDQNNRVKLEIRNPVGQRFLRRIGEEGSFIKPVYCIQHDNYFIATDNRNHCIKVFDKEGKFLYNFGKKGDGDGEFNSPRCLSVDKAGHLLICDFLNSRVQVFKLSGEFITKFGVPDKEKGTFGFPISTAVLSNGRIIVTATHVHVLE
ncbi:PREDICTED: E3 ubiquitin-protein ligase TRIM71-like [Acropora digitifera]|uniref:E3 ubiquitin-protein ligase TRIM71-like n=1 Tax=Acropora digitifera TaxID=70779 RepID=UPI00077ABAA7|nr:PREDICTED: E3 ubiquitin-protein ligase TRIM71-like [Acropora digitifera]